jgi:hypothetical protein
MNAEERLKDAVRKIHARGEYPGPTAINIELYGPIVPGYERRLNQLNGKQTKWRREIMAELGIPLKRPYQTNMHERMYSDYYEWQTGYSGY